ncbi:MAG: T9SS type A sorting domain-containing protein, partial [Chitinophagaceae bacterium]
NYLTPQAPVSADDDDNNSGSDKKCIGPVQNYVNIDTLGTPVMATYSYENKSKISFRYGAKSGSIISNAGERLNSLWFKGFNLIAPSILPINFYSFNVSYDKKNAQLNWAAQADDNLGHFIIEKSTDGVSFREIGQLPASDRVSNYNYTDAAVSSVTGLVYYRIQSREKTGEVNYSPIKIVRLSKDASASITVYPNPVQSVANLTLPFHWQNKTVLVSIYNSNGALLKNMSIKTASQTETLDFQHFSRGIYVVKAQCNDESSEQRILRN